MPTDREGAADGLAMHPPDPNAAAGDHPITDGPAASADLRPSGHRPVVRRRAAVVGALVAATALRGAGVDLMSLWTDEGLSFYRAGLDLGGILAGEIPLDALITRDVQPPAYFLLLSGWLGRVGGAGESAVFAARWLSVLASLPTIALVWALARRWAPDTPSARRRGRPFARGRGALVAADTAAWAAWLTALSPVYLWYSNEARSYTLAVTLGALATYAAWRAVESAGLVGRVRVVGDGDGDGDVGGDRGDPDGGGAGDTEGGDGDGRRVSHAGHPPRPLPDPFGRTRSPRLAAFAWAALAVAADALLAWTHYLGFFIVGFHGLGLAAVAGTELIRARRRKDEGVPAASAPSPAAASEVESRPVARTSMRASGTPRDPDEAAAHGIAPPAKGIDRRSKGRLDRWREHAWLAAALALVALASSPLVPYAVERLGTGAEKDQRFYPLWVLARDGLREFALGRAVDHAGLGWRLAWVWLLMAALVLVGAWHLWRRRPPAAVAALAWLVVPTVAFFALTLVQPRYQGVRHILLQSPPYSLLLAAGITALEPLGRRLRSAALPLPLSLPLLLPLLAGGLALGAMAWADRSYFVDPRFHKDDLRGLAEHVRRRALPTDALVLSDPVLRHVLSVYDPGVPIVSVPPYLADGRFDDRPVAEHLEPLFEAHERLWLMTPHDDVLAWLEANATPVQRTTFHGLGIPVRVEAWERPADIGAGDAPPPSRPLALGPIELLGWEPAPRPFVAGRAGRVDLAWLVTERGGADVKVALRLLDEHGVDWADGDHEPFHGLRPTSEWPFGEMVVEPHDLLVSPGTPPGAYTLAITVYDPASGETIPSDGPYPIGEVAVVQPAADDIRVAAPPFRSRLDARIGPEGGGASIVGWNGPPAGEARLGGSAVPVEIWLRAGDPEGRSDTTALRLELLDARARVVRSASSEVRWDGAAAGELRVARLRLDLPAEAGDYTLRLRAVSPEAAGGLESDRPALWLRSGAPVPLPRRALWLSSVRVEAPSRVTDVPEMARRLDVMVGDDVELLGADLPEGGLPLGAEMPVTLWWRARQAPDVGYHVTVQVLLIDSGDRPIRAPVAQHDGIPAAGTRPITGWSGGEVIEDEHVLRIPDALPAGRYALIAALYDPSAPGTRRPLVRQAPYGDTRDYVIIGVYTVDMLAPDAAGEPPIRR